MATPVVASLEQKKVMILRPITQYSETENTRKTKTDATKIWTQLLKQQLKWSLIKRGIVT